MQKPRSNRGLSPIIGVVLLLVIVIATDTITGGILLGVGDQLDKPAPIFATGGESVQMSVNDSAIVSQSLVLTHRGGQQVDVSNL